MNYFIIPGLRIQLTPEYLIKVTAKVLKVDESLVTKKTRKQPVPDFKHVCAFFLIHALNMKTAVAGLLTGERDHSSACASVRRVKALYAIDRKYRENINVLADTFGVDLLNIDGIKPLRVNKFIDGKYHCTNCGQYSED